TSRGLRHNGGKYARRYPHHCYPLFWRSALLGQRIFALGAGPRPIPRKRLSVEQLAAAIQAATCDEVMCMRSAALGECILKEDGVTQAVEVLHRHLHITV